MKPGLFPEYFVVCPGPSIKKPIINKIKYSSKNNQTQVKILSNRIIGMRVRKRMSPIPSPNDHDFEGD